MASKATERIARTMSKLRMEGKLDQPYYPNGKPKPKKKKAEVKKVELTAEQQACCKYKYNGDLPEHFRPCRGCTVS